MATGELMISQSSALAKRSDETAAGVLAAQAKALVEARFIVAMQRPRDLDEVRAALLKECKRPSFAKVARYNKPVGGGIKGPSIRFAEAAIRCMKNISTDTPAIYDDREKRILRVTVTDIENNISYSQDVTIAKTVERRKAQEGDVIVKQRLNSKGEPVFVLEATDDDILNKQNALISKAVRTLGLRLVPGDLVDEGMEQVIATQRDQDSKDPDAAKKILLDAFASVGVTVAQIKDYLEHSVETLEPKELTDLRGLYTAIRDGEATWREVMESKAEDDKGKKTEEPKGAPAASRTAAVLDKVKQHQSSVPSNEATTQPQTASESNGKQTEAAQVVYAEGFEVDGKKGLRGTIVKTWPAKAVPKERKESSWILGVEMAAKDKDGKEVNISMSTFDKKLHPLLNKHIEGKVCSFFIAIKDKYYNIMGLHKIGNTEFECNQEGQWVPVIQVNQDLKDAQAQTSETKVEPEPEGPDPWKDGQQPSGDDLFKK